MSEDAAILAQFSDWRTVKGRKVLQLIFEVPLEEQAKVLTHLGAPMPMTDLWCGIARVSRSAAHAPGKAGAAHPGRSAKPHFAVEGNSPAPPATDSVTLVEGETGGAPRVLTAAPPVSKSKRRWSEMPPSQRAALRVKDPSFWAFLTAFTQATVDNENTADGYVKAYCGVTSKADLTDMAARTFDELDGRYVAFQQARGHGVI